MYKAVISFVHRLFRNCQGMTLTHVTVSTLGMFEYGQVSAFRASSEASLVSWGGDNYSPLFSCRRFLWGDRGKAGYMPVESRHRSRNNRDFHNLARD